MFYHDGGLRVAEDKLSSKRGVTPRWGAKNPRAGQKARAAKYHLEFAHWLFFCDWLDHNWFFFLVVTVATSCNHKNKANNCKCFDALRHLLLLLSVRKALAEIPPRPVLAIRSVFGRAASNLLKLRRKRYVPQDMLAGCGAKASMTGTILPEAL
ncbi:hypothetical protein [Pseudaestuariivita rosea]|uniref:hypothetical protein n=1 Tax=Pseudaestuariivita rosea TaxID=2763263 RepID=UPI001ABA1907|nr:hypothetical protein [Pseudaestuariivita rosea]